MTTTASNTEPENAIKLQLSRRFNASPEQVFDAWLDPKAVGRWLFATPDGVMKTVEIDARVGGRFRIDEQRGDTLASHVGEYLEMARPRRLVFNFATDDESAPSLVTIEISPTETGCLLHLTHEMERKWQEYTELVHEGWSKILDGLGLTFDEDSSLTLNRLIAAPRSC